MTNDDTAAAATEDPSSLQNKEMGSLPDDTASEEAAGTEQEASEAGEQTSATLDNNGSGGLLQDAWNSPTKDSTAERNEIPEFQDEDAEITATMNDDQQETEEVDNLVEMEEEEDTDDKTDKSPSSPRAAGGGAQLLMSRFSSWREKANETMKSNSFSRPAVFAARGEQDVLSASHSSESRSSSGSSSMTADSETTDNNKIQVGGGVVDTVASGFRGRYSGSGTPSTPADSQHSLLNKRSPAPNMTQSQTALILQSRAATHMQKILDSLEPHEYVMLLGNGMLGVNLKQAYLKNNGVYMDYLVQGGAAELSGVISVGDNLMKVGDIDVFRRGLIINVPQTIAAAKRPVVLVLSTGQPIPIERMNHVDVAIGMMHCIREEKETRRDIASLPLTDQNDKTENESNGDITSNNDATETTDGVVEKKEEMDYSVSAPSFEGSDPANLLPPPPLALRKAVSQYVTRRCNDKFSLSMLCQAATTNTDFRAVLQNAFVTCVSDGRRLPFLTAHFSDQDSLDGDTRPDNDDDDKEDYQRTTASTQLMLFLELMTFMELYSLTPETKRRDIAKRIALKFFLPSKFGNSLEPPMFDFHHIVPDTDLRVLEKALNDTDHAIGPSIFVPFQKAIVESLSGAPFLSFLISDDCARMRGFLRNTAPFQTVSPGVIFNALVGGKNHPAMENRLLYLVLHLICQLEKEVGDEHVGLNGDDLERVMGAAGGITCAVYIKRRLLNTMDAAIQARESESVDETTLPDLIKAVELVWETFIAPGGGMLESVSNSNETEGCLRKVREMLLEAASSGQDALLASLTNADLYEELASLSDNLLYDYAVNTYSKFKEHRFHEWLCNESIMGERDDETQEKTLDLKTGCIGRLLRKAKLPTGVSPHKPIRTTQQISPSDKKEGDTGSASNIIGSDHNAEFAVVFGTDDGSGESTPIPNPAMDRTDIRRYVCQRVCSEVEQSTKESQFRVPQTLESYVTVPLLRRTPFSTLADDTRISSDGWEISLVNFMIPNADQDSENHDEKALYGVSLVFQKRDVSLDPSSRVNSQLVLEQVSAGTPEKTPQAETAVDDKLDGPSFVSPIRVRAPTSETARSISVPMETPEFNRRLEQKSWLERMEDRKRVISGPVTIGVALLCRRNVVLAMRETLSRFLLDHCSSEGHSSSSRQQPKLMCAPLIELLGNFSHSGVEAVALKGILEPYLRFGSFPWVERPLLDQKRDFEIVAGQHLVNCLPPIPLALLFVTLLLEQKVVFSSSRRSVLFSAVTSVIGLLEPLSWSHLLVPLVPSALARDLLQYPAPFILGISSEDRGNMQVLNSLPADVTLVDLDVGRVILAPSFAHDSELIRASQDRAVTAAALRSQVLYLAQSLGLLFGARLHEETWNVDSPYASFAVKEDQSNNVSDIDRLKSVCRSFLVELLAGTTSCCFWIEEQGENNSAECTVLFDEDRFFHMKNLRARNRYKPLFSQEDNMSMALSLDDFDLVLESFLRCQSMSTYVSSRPKTEMAYY